MAPPLVFFKRVAFAADRGANAAWARGHKAALARGPGTGPIGAATGAGAHAPGASRAGVCFWDHFGAHRLTLAWIPNLQESAGL